MAVLLFSRVSRGLEVPPHFFFVQPRWPCCFVHVFLRGQDLNWQFPLLCMRLSPLPDLTQMCEDVEHELAAPLQSWLSQKCPVSRFQTQGALLLKPHWKRNFQNAYEALVCVLQAKEPHKALAVGWLPANRFPLFTRRFPLPLFVWVLQSACIVACLHNFWGYLVLQGSTSPATFIFN